MYWFNKYRSYLKSPQAYYYFLEKTDLSRFPALQIGAIDKLEEAGRKRALPMDGGLSAFAKAISFAGLRTGRGRFHTALRVMDWLSAHTHYCGLQFRLIPDRTPAILAYGYDKPFRNAINCRFKAIAMADCLLALQKKAYPVALIAQKEKGKDQPCHLMVQMYARELEKWVVFDPSFRTYFLDETGRPLDIFELREQFMEEKTPRFPGYDLNGSDGLQDIYIQSFVKPALTNITT